MLLALGFVPGRDLCSTTTTFELGVDVLPEQPKVGAPGFDLPGTLHLRGGAIVDQVELTGGRAIETIHVFLLHAA